MAAATELQGQQRRWHAGGGSATVVAVAVAAAAGARSRRSRQSRRTARRVRQVRRVLRQVPRVRRRPVPPHQNAYRTRLLSGLSSTFSGSGRGVELLAVSAWPVRHVAFQRWYARSCCELRKAEFVSDMREIQSEMHTLNVSREVRISEMQDTYKIQSGYMYLQR